MINNLVNALAPTFYIDIKDTFIISKLHIWAIVLQVFKIFEFKDMSFHFQIVRKKMEVLSQFYISFYVQKVVNKFIIRLKKKIYTYARAHTHIHTHTYKFTIYLHNHCPWCNFRAINRCSVSINILCISVS